MSLPDGPTLSTRSARAPSVLRTAVTASSRLVPVVYADRDSACRTPSRPLYPIPEEARDPFAPEPPRALPALESRLDLTRLGAGRPPADGTHILVSGRILDEALRPVRAAVVEIWNCNAYGRYSHVEDRHNPEAPIDPNFYGFGRLRTDQAGRYELRTVRPGPYIARRDIGWWRPPHIHLSILGSGVRLATQLYFPGEALNAKDFIFNVVPRAERSRVLVTPASEPGREPSYWHDIVVRGVERTPFDADLG